ncbi:AI-2E family transporter [Tunturibacter empetritectus]|uniref:AI-2E family transporter n=1 Tax=Tunturiibacter empetritectus TaxID=3069691 RepID=A0AAU7ZH56_9BACT
MNRKSNLTETAQLLRIVTLVVIVAALYFGKSVFIPLALAFLLSLLLAPLMTLLGKLRIPRIGAVLIIATGLCLLAFAFAWKLSMEVTDLTLQLPTYKATLEQKIHAVGALRGSNFSKVSDALGDLEKDLKPQNESTQQDRGKKPLPGASLQRPLAVEVVPESHTFAFLESAVESMGSAGLVVIFTIFVLIGREDLRNRFIHLSSGGRLHVMTQALDEATRRIQRYLLLQSMVNAIFGLVVGIGLYFIGIPEAWLWGLLAAILRFLPYIGAPASAAVPILLSLAVFPGWKHCFGTTAFFLALELVVANFVEPLLYGAQVGLSSLAILVAAVFWTLIWGFPGLILATPLTVSLVVMGRYVPSLSFLDTLLGDEPEISKSGLYYQRLLASDQAEARQVLEQYLETKHLDDLYTEVLIPALSLVEQDRHRNELDDATLAFIMQSTRELIEELGESAPVEATNRQLLGSDAESRIACIPARDEADEVVGMLLCQSLDRAGLVSQSIPTGPVAEMLSAVADLDPVVVCISALPPFAIEHTRTLYHKLRAKFPEINIIICLWQFAGDLEKTQRRLKTSNGHPVFFTLPEVLEHVKDKLLQPKAGSTSTVELDGAVLLADEERISDSV